MPDATLLGRRCDHNDFAKVPELLFERSKTWREYAVVVCQKDTHGVLNHASKLVAKKRRLVGRDGTWEEYLERNKGGGDGEE